MSKKKRMSPEKLAELWPKARTDYLRGEGTTALSKKYGINLSTLKCRIRDEGLAKKRKEIAEEKKKAIVMAQSKVNEEMAAAVKDEIIAKDKAEIEQHYQWRREQLEHMKGRLDTDAESVDKLSVYAGNAEKIDNFARKTFNLDKDANVSNEQKWIGFLVNVQPSELPKKDNEKVIEATIVD